MFITVAICTWNRSKLLQQTLEQMCALHIPAGVEWELLVVDNNCTDTTPKVVESYVGRLPLQRLVEKRQGQSNARNCAMEAAKGDILVWTDDDVLVDEHWLAAYAEAAERWPQAGYFGGLIMPWFEQTPPDWFQPNARVLEGVMVTRDLGPTEYIFKQDESPYGANMAFRRSAFTGRRFDPNLGLVGDNAIRCDETEYCKGLNRAGIAGVWVPSAKVRHFVVAKRMTLRYLWSHFKGDGRARVRIDGQSAGKRALGAPRWLYRQYLGIWAQVFWRGLRRDPRWLDSFTYAAHLRGVILEHRESDTASLNSVTSVPVDESLT